MFTIAYTVKLLELILNPFQHGIVRCVVQSHPYKIKVYEVPLIKGRKQESVCFLLGIYGNVCSPFAHF